MRFPTFNRAYEALFAEAGMERHYVYDPLHGVGLAEVEEYRPRNDDPDYAVQPGYTYQMDNFLLADHFGCRFETGICIRENGVEPLSGPLGALYELGF